MQVKMQKKLSILFIVLTLIAVLAVGCTKKNTNPAPSGNQYTPGPSTSEPAQQNEPTVKVVKGLDPFRGTYMRWTSQLESYADRVDESYSQWESGKIDVNRFVEDLQTIQNEMEPLNRETDSLTEFSLTASEKKEAQYQQVRGLYQHASARLYNFCYDSSHTPDAALKVKYQKEIKGTFRKELASLKKQLDM